MRRHPLSLPGQPCLRPHSMCRRQAKHPPNLEALGVGPLQRTTRRRAVPMRYHDSQQQRQQRPSGPADAASAPVPGLPDIPSPTAGAFLTDRVMMGHVNQLPGMGRQWQLVLAAAVTLADTFPSPVCCAQELLSARNTLVMTSCRSGG